MTQTSTGRRTAGGAVQVVPPAGPGTATSAPAVRRGVGPTLVGRVLAALSGSPGRLRIAAALAALACVVLALLGASALQVRANALEDARRDAAQLVRVQEVAADLARADAAVSNGFLNGGAEPVALTAEYDEAVAAASRQLVDAARAAPQDGRDLALANALLTDYTRQVAHARDNNRLNLPLGSGYLVIASQTVLRDQIVPLLDSSAQSSASRVEDAFDRADGATVRLTIGALVALGGLLGVQAWLARRTRRFVNAGLAAATLAVLVGVGAGFVALSSSGRRADDVRATSYAAAQALATARNGVYSAKGLESLTLVKQGGGGAYEAQWKEQKAAVDAALERASKAGANVAGVRSALAQWTTTHALVRTLDDGGDWPTAVVVATRTSGAPTPAAGKGRASNADFAAVGNAIDPLLKAQATTVTMQLGRPWTGLQVTGWAILVLGLAAALAAVAGVSQRLEEYR